MNRLDAIAARYTLANDADRSSLPDRGVSLLEDAIADGSYLLDLVLMVADAECETLDQRGELWEHFFGEDQTRRFCWPCRIRKKASEIEPTRAQRNIAAAKEAKELAKKMPEWKKTGLNLRGEK